MPQFRYRALQPSGDEITGELIAAGEREVVAQLQSSGSYPIEIASIRHSRAAGPQIKLRAITRRITSADLALLTRKLASLTTAGVSIDRALTLMRDGGGSRPAARLAGELLASIHRGESLSDACSKQPTLPRHYSLIIAAGEARGDIGVAFDRLAQVLENGRALSRALLAALLYPAAVFLVACASIAFLVCFVLPRFELLLASFQRQPPFMMEVLLTLAGAVRVAAPPGAILAAVLSGIFVVRNRRRAIPAAAYDLALGLPGLGALLRKAEAERLLYLLGSLALSGVQLPAAVAATRVAMHSQAFRAGLARTEQSLDRGDGVAAALGAGGTLPDVVLELARIGEENGNVAAMLLKAGELLRRDLDELSPQLIGLVTPISVILLGVVIGAVAVAMLNTIMDLYDIAG